jgi:hypothetical protein
MQVPIRVTDCTDTEIRHVRKMHHDVLLLLDGYFSSLVVSKLNDFT